MRVSQLCKKSHKILIDGGPSKRAWAPRPPATPRLTDWPRALYTIRTVTPLTCHLNTVERARRQVADIGYEYIWVPPGQDKFALHADRQGLCQRRCQPQSRRLLLPPVAPTVLPAWTPVVWGSSHHPLPLPSLFPLPSHHLPSPHAGTRAREFSLPFQRECVVLLPLTRGAVEPTHSRPPSWRRLNQGCLGVVMWCSWCQKRCRTWKRRPLMWR